MHSKEKSSKSFEIRGWSLCNSDQEIAFDEDYICEMIEEAQKYEINYIELVGPYYNQPQRCPIDSLIEYKEFSELNKSKSMPRDLESVKAENAKFNRICKKAKSLGIQTSVWFHELWFPSDILDFYPQMGDSKGNLVYSSSLFKKFFKSKFTELFETIPDLNSIVLTTCESLTLDIFNLPAALDKKLSKSEAFIDMVNTIAEICDQYSRSLYVRTFGSNDPAKFKLLVDSFKKINTNVRIHQKTCDFGDWQNPYQSSNPNHGVFGRRFEIAEEEIGFEYFGLGEYPLMYPEVIKSRVDNCCSNNVKGVVARIDRGPNRTWEHEGQVNILVYSSLVNNKDENIAKVIHNWAEEYYGPAWPYAINALQMGCSIFSELTFIYPGQKIDTYRRGRYFEIEVIMENEHGPFRAMQEIGDWRTSKQLALKRCQIILDEIELAASQKSKCSDLQKQHLQSLMHKFYQLYNYGKERIDILEVVEKYGDLFFSSYNKPVNLKQFLDSVKIFQKKYGEKTIVKDLIESLKQFKKLDTSEFHEYMGFDDSLGE